MNQRFKRLLIATLAFGMLPIGSAISSESSAAAAVKPAVTAAAAVNPAASPATASSAVANTAFKQVLAGSYYSLALRNDGTVWAWGRNLLGEIGVLQQNAVSTIAAPVRLPKLSGIAAIATNGGGMNVGLKSDGTVWEWGSIAGLKASPRDSALPAQVPGLANVAAVTALNGAGVALTGSGKLLIWSHDAATGKAAVVPVAGTYKWNRLISCGDVAFALDDTGGVWGLGARREPDGGVTLVQPFKLKGIPAMKQISAYANYGQMYGVDRSGGAWTWKLSANAYYQGSKPGPASVSGKPSRLYPQLKAKEIQAGGYGILLTEGGDVWTIGKGPTGKSGQVKGLSGIASIASGYYHNLALDAKGRVWGWGADNWNETGSLRPHGDGMMYAPALIQTPINVYVDGKLLVSAFPARIDNGSVSVPMKAVLQALGGSFSFSSDYKTTILYKGTTAVLHPDDNLAEVNGAQVGLPPIVRGFTGVSMIPAGLLKLLGVHASWDAKLGELRLVSA
ncbi:stalk domain-containing protein [Paenibacillus glycinis]|uniref:Copper amine oxidase-like N-terminal domain-containing protein n=1 Tax=Paenibacillus glycinis TaxID=2697035 RepID=A0ABW9XN42_9BACL|nr:stalk domain-containing protein [Paenibacillus glycinis]NBD24046.1 hypothetical protein [Paenibacillus glycinis]